MELFIRLHLNWSICKLKKKKIYIYFKELHEKVILCLPLGNIETKVQAHYILFYYLHSPPPFMFFNYYQFWSKKRKKKNLYVERIKLYLHSLMKYSNDDGILLTNKHNENIAEPLGNIRKNEYLFLPAIIRYSWTFGIALHYLLLID